MHFVECWIRVRIELNERTDGRVDGQLNGGTINSNMPRCFEPSIYSNTCKQTSSTVSAAFLPCIFHDCVFCSLIFISILLFAPIQLQNQNICNSIQFIRNGKPNSTSALNGLKYYFFSLLNSNTCFAHRVPMMLLVGL